MSWESEGQHWGKLSGSGWGEEEEEDEEEELRGRRTGFLGSLRQHGD